MATASSRGAKWHLGLICLAAVVIIWVASGFLVQAMAHDWAKPYFVTYLTTATFVVYLYPTVAKFRQTKNSLYEDLESSPVDSDTPLAVNQTAYSSSESDTTATITNPSDSTNKSFSTYETALLGCQFGALWFTSNLLNNASYMYTSVSTATILACTSSFFTLIIGSIFEVEKFTMPKLSALCMSIIGVCLVIKSLGSDVASKDTVFGNCLALGSALLYGVYSTLLKYKVGNESNLDSKMFLGFVGLFNIVVLWPLLVVLHLSGLETFALPSSVKIWSFLLINCGISLAGDLLWVLAMLMTSPLVVTVGLGATIPLSMLGEMFISNTSAGLVYCLGAACVCWSFIIINREEEHDMGIDQPTGSTE